MEHKMIKQTDTLWGAWSSQSAREAGEPPVLMARGEDMLQVAAGSGLFDAAMFPHWEPVDVGIAPVVSEADEVHARTAELNSDAGLQKHVAALRKTALDLFWRKNADYGTANILEAGAQGIVTRMQDKFARLKRLLPEWERGDAYVPGGRVGEPLLDTVIDIHNYAMILGLVLQYQWPGQLAKALNEQFFPWQSPDWRETQQKQLAERLGAAVVPPPYSEMRAGSSGQSKRGVCAELREADLRGVTGREFAEAARASQALAANDNALPLPTLVDPERPALQVRFDGEPTLFAPQKAGDVGYDLAISEDFVVPPTSRPVYVRTGAYIKCPPNTWARLVGRSSTSRRLGLTLVEGVLDEGYTGELYVGIINHTNAAVQLTKGQRIAQVILCPSVTPALRTVDALPTTERGDTGFGSTGDR